MKSKPRRRPPQAVESGGNSLRGTILLVVLLVLVGLIFLGLKRLGNSHGNSPSVQKQQERAAVPNDTRTEIDRSKVAVGPQSKTAVVAAAAAVLPAPNQAPTHSQELVKSLTQIELSGGTITREQAEAWKQKLQELILQGGDAVPAISEFLKRNVDLNFQSIPAGNNLGYGSLRFALFDALQKIGGPEAIAVSRETLKTTADPMEVALLSRSLEQQAPGQYRQEELNSAREVLNQALKGRLRERGDVAPLFELLQAYGDESVIPDLVNTVPHWHHYATFALAGLPEGIGIPTLIKLAKDPEVNSLGNGDFALLPLTQIATQYPQAATALVEQARSNTIRQSAWPSVATALAGTHSEYGKKIFGRTTLEARMTSDEVNKRLNLVDQMLAANTNPGAAQFLQQARVILAAKTR